MADVLVTRGGLEYGLRSMVGTHLHDPTAGSCDHCSELGYVMRSTVLTLRRSPGYRDMGEREFEPYALEVRRRLFDPTVTSLVAYDPCDPWLVMGFVIGEPGIVTALHVRGTFRNMGLAEALAAELGITPGTHGIVEFPTCDVLRERPGRTLPVGLIHNGRWSLTARPWHPAGSP